MTRVEALAKATELVDDFAPRRNERGYTDRGVITVAERVALVLNVADWLLAGEPAMPTGLLVVDGELERRELAP